MNFRIKELLKEKAITALALAKEVSMTQANMSNIMTGKTKPSLDTLEKIAFALNVPITELFEQPQTDVINCPNCGARLSLSKKE